MTSHPFIDTIATEVQLQDINQYLVAQNQCSVEAQGFYIDTDEATYIENQDGTYHSYTFMIFRPVDNGLLENLLFSLQADGSYKTFIIAYDLTQEEQENFANGLYVTMENCFSITQIETGDLNPDTLNRMSNECIVGQNTYWMCGNHKVGHNADTPRDICQADSFEYIVELIWRQCPIDGGPSNDSSPDDGEDNGDTGTGTGGETSNPDVSSPTYIEQPWEKIVDCIDIIDLNEVDYAAQLSWLKEHKTQAGYMDTYLSNNECSVEAQSFAMFTIVNAVSIEDALFVIDNLEDYRNHMSEDELNLFDTLTENEQTLYLVSAKQALDKTDELWETVCEKYNGKGDAFRHAYWNALSSQRIGIALTNQLTTRHENQPPLYSYSNKETEMDLFNNQVGRDIVSNGFTNLLLMPEQILNSLNSGNLRYLSNQATSPNCRATFASQLIPTNQ